MAYHEAFETVGTEPGRYVWRVVKMDLELLPVEYHGEFFTGDCYIVLNNTDEGSKVYNWIGDEASSDEKACSAIFMVQLDDKLGGAPVQSTEFQGWESPLFLGNFKDGITYKNGGADSGLNHMKTNTEGKPRVLHVKGRRCIRAKEVAVTWASFNKGDCFIIDLGEVLYLWEGSECNRFECIKATEYAKGIRDNERHGRAKVHMIVEGEENEDLNKLLGSMPDLPSGSCDKSSDKEHANHASLYKISDAEGDMKTTLMAEKNPFKQGELSSAECYIVDNKGGRRVFVWKGKKANKAERKAAFAVAEKFIKENNYDAKTQVLVMPEGGETTMFTQFFFNWLEKYETTCPSANVRSRIAKVEQIPFDASTLHSNRVMAARHGMVDDGSGKVQIWRVEGEDKVAVDPSTYGQFYGGDCYLVLYSYNCDGTERHIIYTWQGKKCDKIELGSSAILTIALDDSMGGIATQVRVTQGQEPAHLVSLFKNSPFIIYLGGTSRDGGQSQPAQNRLFHVRRNSTKATWAIEVEAIASQLNTNDVFVAKTPDTQFLWRGTGAIQEELTRAQDVVKILGGVATEVEEGSEPDSFWEALGGKTQYQTSESLQSPSRRPRLFGCSNKTGRLIAEEVPGDITQLDLAPDDVMILDTRDQIFVWIGNEANDIERAGAPKIAEDYLESSPCGCRKDTSITFIKQGHEPFNFTGWFHAWDPKMWG